MTVVGVLLAGGKSARMGEDKGGLVLPDAIDGETLGARAVRVLRAVCDEVVCAGHGAGVPADVSRLVDPGEGPLVALAGALTTLARPSCTFVVLPVDMPGVDVPCLARLLAAPRGLAACFSVDGRFEPLPLVLGEGATALLADAVARGERRLREGVRSLDPALVPLAGADAQMVENINRPTDLHAWTSRHPGR